MKPSMTDVLLLEVIFGLQRHGLSAGFCINEVRNHVWTGRHVARILVAA